MSEQSLISTLEKQYQEKDIEHVMQELYNYISQNKNFNAVSAKALVHIIIHDSKDEALNKSLLSFIEIIFEDKLNNNKMRDAKYYIGKAMRGDVKGHNVETPPAETTADAEAQDELKKEGEKSETTTKPEQITPPSETAEATEAEEKIEPEDVEEVEEQEDVEDAEESETPPPPSLG